MLPLRAPAWIAALTLTAAQGAADPAQTPQRNVLVAASVEDSSQIYIGIMSNEQTCWQAAFMLNKASPGQVFYCVENPVKTPVPALAPKGKVVRS